MACVNYFKTRKIIQIVDDEEMRGMHSELSGKYVAAMREDLLLHHLSPKHQREMADNFADKDLGINSIRLNR